MSKRKPLLPISKSDREKRITLSDADFDRLIEHLKHPPEPNKKLKAAFKKYKEGNK
jgi:uncharacterized protein (DUF1778 family)